MPLLTLVSALVLAAPQAITPLEIGRQEVAQFGNRVQVSVHPSKQKESFTISSKDGRIRIVGSDAVGAMYGAFEFAERVKNEGEKAWTTTVTQSPYLAERGLNLFTTLPWDYKKNDTDYDPAALVDPERWWFQNDDYWVTLLDLMAHSRLNWLDIHGMWDISVTDAPNLYAYFVTSPSFPLVGVSEAIKAKNLARLNKVIEMAHQRGIKVSLMAYQASLRIPQNPNPPYPSDEATVYKYTKEVVEQMIRRAPGLDAIGFRIGESGKGESFFKCYGEALKASGREIPLITRSWITRKQAVLPLARASKDFTVQIKYNGEQWGAPYMVAGGRVANWYSYSFEDYLSDSGRRGAKLWPGNAAEGGGRWPAQPYKIVWQVRANGTHRIFPFYNPEWVRRSITCMKIGTASGYTIEGLDAYYPKSPDYYLANPADKYCDWIHQRDEMYWTTWGRLGYDPTVRDEVFDAQAQRMLGTRELVGAWKRASTLVAKAFMAFSLGPDHRSHAPELEWGGGMDAFVQGQGFDTHSFLPINEELANAATAGIDGRYSLWDFARGILPDRIDYETGDAARKTQSRRAVEIGNAICGLDSLASYYSLRFRSAHESARLEAANGSSVFQREDQTFLSATEEYAQLSSNYYKPFTERLRMHTNTFAWAVEEAKVRAELARLQRLPESKRDVEFYAANMSGPMEANLTWSYNRGTVTVKLAGPKMAKAWLLVKPLPSTAFFHKVPMRKTARGFEVTFTRENSGHAIAAEATNSNDPTAAARFPGVNNSMPYLIVPARSGPTPQIYSAEEAMTFLDPAVITPENYSGMLLGTRAWNFFNQFSKATKRKILEPVQRGMRLIILQQDFNRYKLDWLPKPLGFEGGNWTSFDPGGQLGLAKVDTTDIMWQRFKPSDGWEVFGNGGLARLKHGNGEIWVTSARLMQRMHIPSAARAFVRLLSLGGKEKPTILIDSCSEGADGSSSCHPDLMNSHDIPFETLGEVIANRQGMRSFTPIPGPVWDEDVLNGSGSQMANAFLKGQVVRASRRAVPANLADFEKERVRRKAELMRSLGLDPMPPKTPLNARETGRIQRDGYHIEKVVFESRPRFYVTAHVYVPDGGGFTGGSPIRKLSVIVNVNGHWAHKKDEDRIQLRCAFQALQGYIAIAIDSPGWSFEGNSLIERRPEGNHNDWFLVQGGTNTTGYYVWDTIRALDYMATRPDTDMEHIGITGASGGGLATLYTFAADDRYKAAVPVVYMSSMELAPDNGCLCNHVPGTSQIGDRSDVIAIQAPKPVYIMGARNDGEFPPNAMTLTAEKMKREWALSHHDGDVQVRIFDGPHDYNQLMREASIGFFNKYLKGQGDGSPVTQPALKVIDPEDRQILVLDTPIPSERTMRDLSIEYLENAAKDVSVAHALAINGGIPARSAPNVRESGAGQKRSVVFEAEPGLQTPGVLMLPKGKSRGLRIIVDDAGKASRVAPPAEGYAVLYLDILGTGELKDIDMRYAVYMGRSVAFTGGWQIVRAAEAMKSRYGAVEIEANGALSSQAAMWAGLMSSQFREIDATGCLQDWQEVFRHDVSPFAVQPRAHLLGTLANLRAKVKNATWKP